MLRPTQTVNPYISGRKKWIAGVQNKRAFNPETRKFLHLSGNGETPTELWAWRGSGEQFKNLCAPAGVYILVDVEDGIPEIDEMDRLQYKEEAKQHD